MIKWQRAFLLELRLLINSPFLLILPLLFGVWMAVSLAGIAPPVSQDLYMYVYDFHKVKHTLSLGVAVLIGILMIRRDTSKPSCEWMGGLPVSAAVPFSAKYAVGFLYLSLFTAAMSAVYVYFAVQYKISTDVLLQELLFFAIQYEWSYMVTLALAMLLAVAIRNRIIYLIGFCAWIFGTFFIDIFLIRRLGLVQLEMLRPFHLSQLMLDSFYANEAWGIGLLKPETWSSRFFVLSFTFLMLTVCVFILKTIRPSNTRGKWGLALLAFAGLSVGSYYSYAQIWMPRMAASNELIQHAVQIADGGTDSYVTFPVSSYQLELTKQSPEKVKIKAQLSFKTTDLPEGQAFFSLHPHFHVEQLLLDQESLSFQRTGSLITIDSNQFDRNRTMQNLTFIYKDDGINWRLDPYNNMEQFVSFIKDPSIYLPGVSGWYPAATNKPMFVKDGGSNRVYPSSGDHLPYPSDFDVTWQGFTGRIYGNLAEEDVSAISRQHFTQTNVKEASFYAGNFIELQDPDSLMKMVTTPGNRLEAEKFWFDLLKFKAYYEPLLKTELVSIRTLFYFPLENLRIHETRISGISGSSYLIGETKSHNLDDYQLVNAMNAILFGDDKRQVSFADIKEDAQSDKVSNENRPSIFMEIRAAYLYLFYRDGVKLTDEEIRKIAFSQVFLPSTDTDSLNPEQDRTRNQILHQVQEALNDGKSEQVKQVLAFFYQKGLSAPEAPFQYPVYTLDDWNETWNRVVGP
ncbi:hypothetical protein [Paenibacillus sp. FJAT-26967]|uniref:hypothetical protein n=1 Tax=Paenibacillus sp. FJAT-26967 TaxID=1729690 RepID=UPI000839254D|nr:hypothetical protein [Paenibacillus sp. FJAT-26967]